MVLIAAPRAIALVDRLRDATADLVTVIASVDEALWSRSPGPGVWSIGKEAEHVAEAAEVAALIRDRTERGTRLLLTLTDAQLQLPTRPPRARGQQLAEMIDRVLIDHYDGHRREIEAKLAAMSDD